MKGKKILLVSFLITVGFCLLSWACAKLDILTFPFTLFWGILNFGTKTEALFLPIVLFGALWLISLFLTYIIFFTIPETKK